MTFPIRVAVIEPADKPWPAPASQIMGIISSYMRKGQKYVQAEVGCTFDFELHWLRSKYTHEFLALEERRDGTKIDRRDPSDGKGGDSGKVINYCGRQELGFASHIAGQNVMRDVYVVHFFGGWAGGTNGMTQEDSGWALIGDRNLLGVIQRKPIEEVIAPGYAFSHEVFTHMFGISSHPTRWEGGVEVANILPDLTPVPSYLEPFRDGNLTVGQKQQLISKNMRFLRDV